MLAVAEDRGTHERNRKDRGRSPTARDVIELLKDLTTWGAPHGGSGGVINIEALGEYGPGGLIMEGSAFEKEDRALLRESFKALGRSLDWLRSAYPKAFTALTPAYLVDPPDPHVVERWRSVVTSREEKLGNLRIEHDEASQMTHYYDDARGGMEIGRMPYKLQKPQKTGDIIRRMYNNTMEVDVVTPALLLYYHDMAIDLLVENLEGEDLYVLHAKRMSAAEEKDMDRANAEIVAAFDRTKRSGKSAAAAVRQVAREMRISTDYIEGILEFREEIRPDTCMEDGCEKPPKRSHLCDAHYVKQYRNRKKSP